ncbi:MAG: GAF domain-containing sensor histidine kinase [Bacteroidota bacterium]
MDHLDFVNTSLRLRYEAYSTFATKVNQADDLIKVSEAVVGHLKFIVDVFAFRFTTQVDQTTLSFELFRGKCSVNTSTAFTAFEKTHLEKGLPIIIAKPDIQQEPLLQGSLFDHPKMEYLMVMPQKTSDNDLIILSIGSKSPQSYTETDFRFARLIEELLTTKISQLLLAQKIVSKNLALKVANQELFRLNEEVQELNTQLEAKVEERTFALKEAHEELNTLLYRTSHDFRRPLTAILGLANLFVATEEKEERKTLAQHLEGTITGLDRMLEKLQMLQLADAYEAPTSTNLVELVEEIKQKFAREITESGIFFSTEITLTKEYRLPKPMLKAILENLLENAIQYSQKNQPKISLQIWEESSSIFIRVTDNGQGIEEHLQPVIFDMYVRANLASKGNGLGLFVVKKLLETLDGSIIVKSVINQGSTFTITIPVTKERVARLKPLLAQS